jgi:hypothetical protein
VRDLLSVLAVLAVVMFPEMLVIIVVVRLN